MMNEQEVLFLVELDRHLPADELGDVELDDPVGLVRGRDADGRLIVLAAPGRTYALRDGMAFRIDVADDGRQRVRAFRYRELVGEYVE